MSTLVFPPTSLIGSQITAAPSGNVYTPDANGYITVTNSADLPYLIAAGYTVAFPKVDYSGIIIGKLLSANFNVTTDQPILMTQPIALPFRVTKITVRNASISLTTAAGGIYRTTAKGGTAMVAASQAYSGLTGSTLALDLTLATATTVEPAGEQLYLSLTTAQGAAATADVIVFGDVYATP